ncbi:MAG: 2-phospho-L-lactate transferase [Anaerolineales bacterium]|nr:2-phospho-L-lactate transferase [Anaerolineales bacterium]
MHTNDEQQRVVALAGGVGGAKLAQGLQQCVGARLTVVGNVGDDMELYGLHISPDLDTVMYWLAGVNDAERGWGLQGETWHNVETLQRIGAEPWFRLGDRDLATHLQRSQLLRGGQRLTVATARLCEGWGVDATLLPVTDEPLRTVVETNDGLLDFQTYFVREQWQPVVRAIHFEGADSSRLTPEVEAALNNASIIVICPSNPMLSIAPLLAVPTLRQRLQQSKAPVVAVSPIVGGDAVKGPTAKLFRELGEAPTALNVARHYADFIDAFLLDERDDHERRRIEALGLRVATADTLMHSAADRRRVAEAALALGDTF